MQNTLSKHAKGIVTQALGNLLHVKFEGEIQLGEVVFVETCGVQLKGEIIEISGQIAKVQVFEETHGVGYGDPVLFTGELLEVELGPGLLKQVFDGLQNPLDKIAVQTGLYIERGVNFPALDRTKRWFFEPKVTVGSELTAGDLLGIAHEERFGHKIFVPFKLVCRKFKLLSIVEEGHYTVDKVIATAEDEFGALYEWTMMQKWPAKLPLAFGERQRPTEMLDVGLRIIDTQFPLLKGSTACTPGPFGAGKTVFSHHLAKHASVDIVIVVACGERAGEVVEMIQEFPHLIDPKSGETLMSRSVIICNTSSMPVAAREASVYVGITMGEYYRQMGFDVLVLADSTSRWAQAMREMSGRLEEIPGDEAFPAYLASRIAQFYERAGVIKTAFGKGSVSIVGAVSPAGGNFDEPVTQATLIVVGAFIGLSRARSDARRYPAIDPLISWSKYVHEAAKYLQTKEPRWADMVVKAEKHLRKGDEVKRRMEVIGEEGTTLHDFVLYLKVELYDFVYLQQNAFDKEDSYCPIERQIAMFKLMDYIFDAELQFENQDEAKSWFLQMQTEVKNINYVAFPSKSFDQAVEEVIKQISMKQETLL